MIAYVGTLIVYHNRIVKYVHMCDGCVHIHVRKDNALQTARPTATAFSYYEVWTGATVP